MGEPISAEEAERLLDRPIIVETVPLAEAARLLDRGVRAAESLLRYYGVRSGYPRHAVERLAAQPDRRGWRKGAGPLGTGGEERAC